MSMSKFATKAEYFASLKPGVPPATEAKPVVKYKAIPGITAPEVGDYTSVIPVDRPAEYLNGRIATTSYIVAVDGTSFETRNTRYVLDTDEKLDK